MRAPARERAAVVRPARSDSGSVTSFAGGGIGWEGGPGTPAENPLPSVGSAARPA